MSGGRAVATPSVAICVVTHDSEPDLADFFASIDELDPAPAEVVVVDCASGDGSARWLERRATGDVRLRLELSERNLGYAGGMNRALEIARSPWILALNADTRPSVDLLERLLEAVAAPGDEAGPVGAVTPRLVRFGSEGSAPLLDACGMFLTWPWRHHDRGSGAIDRGQHRQREQVFGGTGAALFLRRSALEDVAIDGEAFAGEFHSFREDAELAFRLGERGWRVVYAPAATARHRRLNLPARRSQMPTAVNYHSLKNRYLLRCYHQSALNFVLTLVPTALRDLGALAYVLAFERSSLAAYGWLWRHRKAIARKRRRIQARRTAARAAVEQWFWRRSRPA